MRETTAPLLDMDFSNPKVRTHTSPHTTYKDININKQFTLTGFTLPDHNITLDTTIILYEFYKPVKPINIFFISFKQSSSDKYTNYRSFRTLKIFKHILCVLGYLHNKTYIVGTMYLIANYLRVVAGGGSLMITTTAVYSP